MPNCNTSDGDAVFHHFMLRLKGQYPGDKHVVSNHAPGQNDLYSVEEKHVFSFGGSIVRRSSGDPITRQTVVAYTPVGACVYVQNEKLAVGEMFTTLYEEVSTMFRTTGGHIFVSNFFHSSFAFSVKLKQLIELQNDVSRHDLVGRLESLFLEAGGPQALKEICAYHLDHIEYALRLEFPYDDIFVQF